MIKNSGNHSWTKGTISFLFRNAAQLFDNKKIETIQPIIDEPFYRKNKGFEPELEKNIYEYLKTKLES